MPRRKRKPYDPAAKPIAHDRQATDLVRGAIVTPALVDDPYDPMGARIVVARSLRDDPLARLHVRKQIDDAQYYGGRDFQRDFELAGRGPQAIDPSKEAVDGGKSPEVITEPQRAAAKRLSKAFRALGLDGSALVHMVLVDGQTCAQIARARGLKGERHERYFGMRLQECLDRLAFEYGYSTA